MPHAATLPPCRDALQSQPDRALCQVKRERQAAATAKILSFINMCEFRHLVVRMLFRTLPPLMTSAFHSVPDSRSILCGSVRVRGADPQ
jgi:hypothetical protein